MTRNALLFAACLMLCGQFVSAQITLPVPRNIQKTFDAGTRSSEGAPGKNYWQNRADYDLRFNFDPATRQISGVADIVYYNNSPDTLREILFKLYPNLYQKGAMRAMPIELAEDLTDGVKIEALSVNREVRNPKEYRINGTNMRLRIKSLAPHQQLIMSVRYSYTLNKESHIRTGAIDDSAFFIAYFFPRVAVYDDIDGWNRNPYIGSQEFYNDFCNFKTSVTVPKDYAVWATGDLLNCGEVFTPIFCERIAKAEKSDAVVDIIDSLDLKNGRITTQNPTNTFVFEAKNVTDVAVAISNHYLWKSASVMVDPKTERRTRVDVVFNPQHKDFYEVIDFARKTVEAMSYDFPKWPFPYAHETVFDGLDQMEYPMMVNDNPLEERDQSIELTDHEIFHTMFPFYMGTNETKYGWMDEGWATIGEWIITPIIDPSIQDDYGMASYENIAGREDDLPIVTLSTQETGAAFSTNSYPKPALGYLFAKDALGDEGFYKGLHYYIASWNGKHPMPLDFFNCMNTGSGVDLNWFWKSWFYDNGVPDLSISNVIAKKKKTIVQVSSVGTKPVPVDLTIMYQDGSSEKYHRTVSVWAKGARTIEVEIPMAKPIKEIRLGSMYVPDINKSDNIYPRK